VGEFRSLTVAEQKEGEQGREDRELQPRHRIAFKLKQLAGLHDLACLSCEGDGVCARVISASPRADAATAAEHQLDCVVGADQDEDEHCGRVKGEPDRGGDTRDVLALMPKQGVEAAESFEVLEAEVGEGGVGVNMGLRRQLHLADGQSIEVLGDFVLGEEGPVAVDALDHGPGGWYVKEGWIP